MANVKFTDDLQFEVENLKLSLSSFQQAIVKLEQNIFDLDREIQIEEQRTRVKDPSDCKYSSLAKDQRQRRQNLRSTLEIFREKQSEASRQLKSLSVVPQPRTAGGGSMSRV